MGERRKTLDLIRGLNQDGMASGDNEFAARINAYDLAFKMQVEAPAIFDLSRSPIFTPSPMPLQNESPMSISMATTSSPPTAGETASCGTESFPATSPRIPVLQ